jgi:hypothetical protein
VNIGQPFAQTLTEQWNGARWRVLPQLTTGRGGSLLAISCTGAAHCIAIEAQVRSGTSGPLAEAWNGARCRMLPTANLGTAKGNLLSVSSRGLTAAWPPATTSARPASPGPSPRSGTATVGA